MLSLFLNSETDKCSQKGCWNFKKHSVFVLNRAIFRCWKKFDHARLWSCRQPFLNYEQASHNQQNNAIICNFCQASSKHFNYFFTHAPKICLFQNFLSKIYSAQGLPGFLSLGQAKRQSCLPERKMYLSQTSGQGFFFKPC